MKFAVFAVLLISSLAWSQTAASPGYASKHASVGRKSGRSSTVNTPNTNTLANELTKIEAQGPHAAASSTAPRAAAAAAVPKAPPAQNKNKPIKYSYKPPQGSRQPH